MPLSIPLPAGAKIIINGAVIENGGSANVTLVVHNKANILRDKDVLTQAEADTPAKEIYHTIQNAYLFEANRDEWLRVTDILLAQFERLRPAAGDTIAHIRQLVADDKLYHALRASRRLVALEAGEAAEAGAEGQGETRPGTVQGRQKEITRIKTKIAELEKRISALDD